MLEKLIYLDRLIINGTHKNYSAICATKTDVKKILCRMVSQRKGVGTTQMYWELLRYIVLYGPVSNERLAGKTSIIQIKHHDHVTGKISNKL